MARYAKIDQNHLVVEVIVVDNNDELDNGVESEAKGIEFLTSLYGDISPMYWKKTSYNTHLGKHWVKDESSGDQTESADQSKSFRKNFAGKGYTYDSARDAFIPPRPQKSNGAIIHNSFTLNEETCWYDPPVERPHISHPGSLDYTDDQGRAQTMVVSWDEHKTRWIGAKKIDDNPDESLIAYAWNPTSGTWEDSGFTRAQFLDISYTGD